MEITVAGDQLILSGPVVARDYDEVEGTLAAKPQIKIVILRNSPGGDAPTGYHLGELFRRTSLQTAVSGYCYSSCSRLYLGGKERFLLRSGFTAVTLGKSGRPAIHQTRPLPDNRIRFGFGAI